MSETQLPANKRRRVLFPTLITMVVLAFIIAIISQFWTQKLWYDSVGFEKVFSTLVFTRIGLFFAFGLGFALIVGLNVFVAYRRRPEVLSMRMADPAVRYRYAVEDRKAFFFLGFLALTGFFAGLIGAGGWQKYLMWQNGTDFGITDPQFGTDIGFYVFSLPWLQTLISFGYAAIFLSVMSVAFVYYIYGALRFGVEGRNIPRMTRGVQVHLGVLFGFAMLLYAARLWLSRFALAIESSGVVQGITYTDDNARIPAINIMIGAALFAALLFFAMILIRSWALPGVAVALMVVTFVLVGTAWPAAMQAFEVKPSEPDKEAPYIKRNIEATRYAYGVNEVTVENYTAKTSLTGKELSESAESRVSSRLLDPTLIAPAFEQLQQVRGYYSVPTTLDVDRYKLDGNENPQDIIIAVRELNLDGLQQSQRTWANDHTVYTHGYGVIAARGNQRGEQGEPVWVSRDIPPTGEFEFSIPPRIYFGEQSPSYSIVGRPAGAAPIEVDIPRGGGESTEATQNTYDGKGGIPVGSLWNKVLFAVKFGEPNIVLSNRVNSESKILYDRHPRDRVQNVAPWLTIDGDAYPAVVDGRVVWILDGYTTSNNYPYSQSRSLMNATSDTLTNTAAQIVLPADQINYIRNSVKAVVDAYDGTVELYAWDEKDPILKTWMDAFPGTVKPKSEISQALKEHLRYPVDMFKVQRDVLSRYHVTDAQTFYEDGERWKVPVDPTAPRGAQTLQPPYYLSMARPGQDSGPVFSLTSVYLPNSRENLASFVSVNSEASDEEGYGKLHILQLPSDTQIPGPSQIANAFQADPGVAQALLQYRQSEAEILYGNLLTLPVGNGLLYVEPVYIQRSSDTGSYPVLQFVAASFGDEIGFGQTLDQALRVALGLEANPTPTEGETPNQTPGETPSAEATVQELLDKAANHYKSAQEALRAGNLAEYQRQVDLMGDALERAAKLVQ